MDRDNTILKLKEYVQDYRAQLAKKDQSSLAILADNTKVAFNSLKDDMERNDITCDGLSCFQESFTTLDKAARNGDQQTSEKALREMENSLHEIQESIEQHKALV